MASYLVTIEAEKPQLLTPVQIFEMTAAREIQLSRLLVTYVTTGLLFMLLPGTFLGVWNLLTISSHRAAGTASAGWIQAHGHAQIFGWIGSFILGIGYHSIPKLRRARPLTLWGPWTSWAMWTSGVTLRWLAGVYEWQWRVMLPFSAALELTAFLIFFFGVSGHRSGATEKNKVETWILCVIAGCVGCVSALVINFLAAVFLAWRGLSPVLPHGFDQRFLVLETWGFLVPLVWGFSARWLPIFLGLRNLRTSLLLRALVLNTAGVLAAMFGWMRLSMLLLAAGVVMAIYALRIFEAGERPARTAGVHSSLPLFIRLAYVWAAVAGLLAIWGSFTVNAPGIWGASRHALTVGFLAMMVFSVGQRILPAFSGMKLLFSTRLMFFGLLFLTAGCLLRVTSQILAYQGFAESAWAWLPVSAITEMTAVTLFAVNLLITFAMPAARAIASPAVK